MAEVPQKYPDLLQRKKAFAVLAAPMRDGSPQATPIWFDFTGGILRKKNLATGIG
jgi:hypothetical protein